MKAISIKQPWASLIAHGIKDIENRTWPCPQKYIGQRVLIHASKRRRWVEPTSIFTREQFDAICNDKRFIQGSNTNPQLIDSAIIGSVEIVGCVINHSSIWAEKSMQLKKPLEQDYFNRNGSFASVNFENDIYDYNNQKPICNWVLANPILFSEPIPAKGKLSFWDFNGELPFDEILEADKDVLKRIKENGD